MSAPPRREAMRYFQATYEVSERRGCRLAGLARTVHRYESVRKYQDALRQRKPDLARRRVRFGYKRTYVLLIREGIHVNKKYAYRVYNLEGLLLHYHRSVNVN